MKPWRPSPRSSARSSSRSLSRALLLFACTATFAVLLGCPSGERPVLGTIERQTGTVSETLRIAIPVTNPSGVALRYAFAAEREIPALESVSSISGGPSGGELRWTPLSSHVGTHELTITIASPSGEAYDQTSVLVEILPSSDSAPVFLEPGAGGTYDLTRDPCVRFHVEIRDDDSPGVEIRARGELPNGASLEQSGGKSADFDWCPSPDQIAAAERWTIALSADDGDHPPVPHDYVVVLRSGGGSGCDGDPPAIELVEPRGGQRVTSGTGYDVVVAVTDDVGLREPPILYYTTETPSDPSRPDVTLFSQALFESEGGDRYRARVPSLGLAVGSSEEVFFVVSATDNDDPTGTFCDHRTETLLNSFFAVGGEGGGLATCARCVSSLDCDSGICAPSAGGARCLERCAGSCSGGRECESVTTSEGGRASACTGAGGSVALACTASCTNDANEPNDTRATATPLSRAASGQICAGDRDVFRISGARSGAEVAVVLDGFVSRDGDLDLRLLDGDGRILASSAGVSNSESISYCAPNADPLYAEVFGFLSAANPYNLSVSITPGSCCVNDALEPDDSVGAGRAIVGGDFEGTLCYGDNDYRTFELTRASRVVVTIVADGLAVVDIELYDASGTFIASSSDAGGVLSIDRVLSPGRYAVRIYGYMNEGDDYIGQLEITAAGSSCTLSTECPSGEVCARGSCASDSCAPGSSGACPADHFCPEAGPSGGRSHCAARCLVNADCRSSEACKWFDGGRGCGTRGAAALGAACSSFSDCAAQRVCVGWPGGFCTRAGCTSNSDCESGTYCATLAGVRACALDCAGSPDRCRAGYTCSAARDTGGTSRSLCTP